MILEEPNNMKQLQLVGSDWGHDGLKRVNILGYRAWLPIWNIKYQNFETYIFPVLPHPLPHHQILFRSRGHHHSKKKEKQHYEYGTSNKSYVYLERDNIFFYG